MLHAACPVLRNRLWLNCSVLKAALRAFSTYPDPDGRLTLTKWLQLFSLSAAMAAMVSKCEK